jgi:hypothetical protein
MNAFLIAENGAKTISTDRGRARPEVTSNRFLNPDLV